MSALAALPVSASKGRYRTRLRQGAPPPASLHGAGAGVGHWNKRESRLRSADDALASAVRAFRAASCGDHHALKNLRAKADRVLHARLQLVRDRVHQLQIGSGDREPQTAIAQLVAKEQRLLAEGRAGILRERGIDDAALQP